MYLYMYILMCLCNNLPSVLLNPIQKLEKSLFSKMVWTSKFQQLNHKTFLALVHRVALVNFVNIGDTALRREMC
uniref:Uncharacterized protein n=1 Tax=Octopus bimaculoides TaxID=37653 RepID=A0A0L8HL82_OCTBM